MVYDAEFMEELKAVLSKWYDLFHKKNKPVLVLRTLWNSILMVNFLQV